jgi:glycosyltransferase involved in cell wall biosynthesis
VNDGTKDDSMNVVANYINKGANVVVINQENGGLSCARNNGFCRSTGKYVWFVDSDDYLKDNAISYLIKIIKDNPSIDVFASYMDRYLETKGKYIKKVPKDEKQLWSGFDYLLKGMPKGAAQRFIYKREFLIKNNLQFVKGILHEDGVWGCEMLYLAKKLWLLSDSLYVYRVRGEGSIMSNIKIKSAYDLILGHKILMNFLKEKVERKDQFRFREYIYCQVVCSLGYTKHLYHTLEFDNFYNNNKQYIIDEARWLVRHGSFDISPIIISFSPKLMMYLMLFRKKILRK